MSTDMDTNVDTELKGNTITDETSEHAERLDEGSPATLWQHMRQWWHEPHFIGKTTLAMLILLAFGNIYAMTDGSISPAGVQACYLIAYAALALWQRWPRIMGPILLVIMPIACVITRVYTVADVWPLYLAALLGIGYLMPKWLGAVAPVIGVGVEIGSAMAIDGGVIHPAMFGALNPVAGIVAGYVNAMLTADGTAGASPNTMDWSTTPDSPITTLLAVTSMLFMYAFVSYGMYAKGRDRLRIGERERRRMTRQITQTRLNQRLAGMIHDSVTNDLSQVVMLSYQARAQFDASSNPQLTATMDAIDQRTHAALDGIHKVIDLLLDGERDDNSHAEEQAGAGTRDGSMADGIAALKRMVDVEETKLHELGYHGATHWKGSAPASDPSHLDLVGNLLKEIYANILRHCTPGDDTYDVFVTVDDATMRITEVNPVHETPEAMQGLRSGRGLGLHCAAVEAVGGEFNTGIQDGAWTIDALVPLR
ncbi:hypothetical protein GFD17_09005 [Bifidobacterium sp. SMB2]|uniref:Histidine kinase n=1 Tax=Bifidobacterium saimiriisciurei TaxID=2661627 RepID=A0ABX0CBI0_9BIFI|nr:MULTISPECIES: hypothetical protein [Bifidobacterium]NEG96884.1 hypothetical protein [Bifidobacterium sp. SMB2]NEH11586.1 hypothetical protein [Bifidobacterium saimiriisciurei]